MIANCASSSILRPIHAPSALRPIHRLSNDPSLAQFHPPLPPPGRSSLPSPPLFPHGIALISSLSSPMHRLASPPLSMELPGATHCPAARSRLLSSHHLWAQKSRSCSLHGFSWPQQGILDKEAGKFYAVPQRRKQESGGGKQQREFTRLTVCATARPINDDQGSSVESVPSDADNLAVALMGWMDAFHRFTRPHTIIGTAIGIVSVSLLAIQSLADFSSSFAIGLIQALIPALCMNVYIVGLNQIYDIDIDKVNKPYLPLASGEYSLSTGIAIVTSFAILSLALGMFIGSRPLLWALTVSFVLGTAYSIELPFLRWKRSALAAASCILSVRAIVVQLAFYFHIQTFVFGRAAVLTRPVLFATGFMCFFSVVIALFKDIPDLEGDRVFGIQSFTVRLGQERVFWLCIYLLQAAYGVAMIVGATSQMLWVRVAMVLGHAALASILWLRARRTDLKSKAVISAFYMFVWQLFYAEYLLIPLMR